MTEKQLITITAAILLRDGKYSTEEAVELAYTIIAEVDNQSIGPFRPKATP